MIGYAATEGEKKYPVELQDGKMFVYVPWESSNTVYPNATPTESGLMSAADKEKLDSGYVVKHDSGGYYVEV